MTAKARQRRGGAPGPVLGRTTMEQMSLVEIMSALTERGIDFTGCFDKAVLLQRLVEVSPEATAAEQQPEPEPEQPAVRSRPVAEAPLEPELAEAEAGEEVLQITLAGHCIRMHVRSVMGLAVWAASSVAATRGLELLRRLREQRSAAGEPPPAALELGAGGALPSLLAAVAGHQLLATDGDADVVGLMRRNFALNDLAFDGATGRAEPPQRTCLAPRKLDWMDSSDVDAVLAEWPHGFVLIVAAEVFWNRESASQFVAAVPKLLDVRNAAGLSSAGSATLLVAMSDDLFLDLASHTVAVAAQHGLRLRTQESVSGPSVSTSVYGTVLREDSKVRKRIFCAILH